MPDWPAIIADFGPLCWRVAYRITGHDADAADCCQQAFEAAVRVASRERVRDWPALLTRLTTARALDCLRARKSSRVPELVADPPGRERDPAELAEAGEFAATLREALARLDPAQAEAFCLTALEGLSHADAAVVLGRTANHVGVLCHRARAALRLQLHAHAPDPERHHD